MAETADIPAWIALFMGLYSLAAAIGELRRPGTWRAMLGEAASQTGLRFLTGLFCIALGSAIYLANPWRPDDWLAVLVTVMGAGMVLEGMVILAFGEGFLQLAQRVVGHAWRGWAWLSALLGVALIGVALVRL